jgi:mannose-6-phosphate isomerase-like protein (cupin superfamily)
VRRDHGEVPADDPLPTLALDDAPTVTAPDGSTVRPLLATADGSVARFELEAGRTSLAVRHRTVEEIWVVVEGRGAMWRRRGGDESEVALEPGVSLVIPVGTSFQFRSDGPGVLVVLAVTLPPWPGPDEAESVAGRPGW